MGDRRNIIVEFNNENSVALYTHWSGSEMEEVLARALDRGRSRWSDPTYLTRIIFSEMIFSYRAGHVVETLLDETGFGIEPFKTGTTAYCEASPGYDLIVNIQGDHIEGDNDGAGARLSFEQFITKYAPKPVSA